MTNDQLTQLLAPLPVDTTLYPPNSRYHGVATKIYKSGNADPIRYLSRRFVPPSEQYALLYMHTVTEGERLDIITAQYLDDPEQFWRICDANDAIRPEALTEIAGRMVRITLPEGIPGADRA